MSEREEMDEPIFRFSMRATRRDLDGYYVTRWDLAEKMTVLGHTQEEAMGKAMKMLGEAGRRRKWVFAFDSSDELDKAGGERA